MLTSGDVVDLDLGTEQVGKQLDADPSVIHVVPLTSTLREFGSEVETESDAINGLDVTSAAQCQHVRAASTSRIDAVRGNVGVAKLRQVREELAVLLDI